MRMTLKRIGEAAFFLHLFSAYCLLCAVTARADAPLNVTGTAADPFTALSQAHNVSTDGIYYFNINDVEFSTFVNTDAWVMVLRDDDQDTSSNPLNASTALSDSSIDDILSPSVLSTLRDAVETKIRLFRADGTDIINAVSSDSRYIDAITASQPLYPGILNVGTRTVIEHQAMAQTWTGTGATYMGIDRGTAHCDDDVQTNLAQTLYHVCGISHTLLANFDFSAGFVHGITSNHYSELYVRANKAPIVTNAIANQSVDEDNAFSFTLPSNTFDDEDSDNSLILSVTSTLPDWISFNASTGTFSGTPSNDDVATVSITVRATDESQGSVDDSFVVTVANVNDAPIVANAIADQDATEDSIFSLPLPGSIFADVDIGDTVTVSVTDKPDWLSFSAGTLSGTPDNDVVGDHTITVTGTDESSAAVSDTFVLSVINVNDAPTLNTAITDQSATEDVLFEFVLPAANFEDVDSGDTIVLSISSTLPAWLSFNSSTGLLSGTPTNSDVATLGITVRATDSSALFVEDSFDISVANVNDNPTVANPIPDQSTDEDSAFNFVLPTSSFADDDGDTLALSVTSTLPNWLSFNAATATFSGTPLNADVADSSITVRASDASASVSDSFVVSVRNTNDAPTLTTAVTDQAASEDAAFSYVVPLATFEDVDLNDTLSYSAPTLPAWLSFSSATRTLSGSPSNNHVGDNAVVIRATDEANAYTETTFNVVVGNSNDAPTLNQGIPDQNATEDVAFTFSVPSNTFADPDAGDTLSYTIVSGPSWLSVSGSTLSGTPAQTDVGNASMTLRATDSGALSADASFSLSVIEVNDNAPVFSSATAISINENTTGVFYTATANDADSGDNLTFTVSGGDDAALFTLVESTGALSFLNSPDYETADDAGGDHVYELNLSATDAANNVASIVLEITLVDVNDNAPSFSSPSVHLAPEGGGSTGLIVSASDADSDDTVIYAIAGGDDAAHFDIHPSTGVLSFAHPLDYEQPRDANNDNTYSLVLRAQDAAANETTLALDVVLQDTNDNAPRLTSSDSVSIDENSATLGYTATATDPDTSDTITFGIEAGLDGALFSIDPHTGLLNFVTSPDFEAAADTDTDNIYVLTLSATDSALLKSTATLTVTVEDLNDTAPIFASPSAVSIGEDNFSVGYTALASDPDSDDEPALSLRYAIDGGSDAALFSIVPTTGQVTFISAPDFEAPDDAGNDHVYNLRLRASDTASNSSVHDLAITLLDANDNAPAFTSLPSTTIAEGSTGVFYTATATDPDSNDAATFSIVDGNAAGLFSIDANTGVMSVSAVDFEQPGAGSSNNVYSLTLRGTDTGGLSKDYVLAITVSDVNDNSPTITSVDSLRVDENTTVIAYNASATDPDSNDTLSWGFGGGVDDAFFSIDTNTGALRFLNAPDAEIPTDDGADNVYNITLRALDAAANSSDLAITVTVDNLNDNAPVFSSALTANTDEGSSSSPYTAVAVDADTDSLHYEIDSGADASMFSIDATTGVLTFDQELDHEAPEDSDSDNVYNLVIAAIDPGDLRTTHAVAITVNDLNDNAPSISSGSALSVPEGNIATGYTATSTDPDSADSVTYTLGGADSALFSLDVSGVLSFLNAPNFEAPSDADADNAYALTLTATDAASNASNLAIVVSVTDVNDQSPVFSSAAVADISEGSTANFYAAQASDSDAGDNIAFSLTGADADLFSIHVSTGALQLRAPADFENPNDADNNGQYALVLRALDSGGHLTEQALVVTLRNINESPSVQPQTFNVSEFANPGASVGSLLGSDPENDALHWTLLTADSPFTLSDNGVISVAGELDFEAIASFNLSVQASDDLLSSSAIVTINLDDESEITRLVQSLPVSIAELSAEGITNAVLGREDYYNNAIAEANPQPSTVAQLQAIITRANATAELVEGGSNAGGSTTTVMQTLNNVGVTDTDSDNAAAYQRAIENANPTPNSAAELQAIVNEVNAVQNILSNTESLHSGSGNTDTLKQALESLSTMPNIPDEMLAELAAQIARTDPLPTTEAEIATLSTALLERAVNHPVVYLSLEQDGGQVHRLRPDGGTVSVTAHIANPVPGLTVSYDWQSSAQQLLDYASVANPVTETLSFDPALLPPQETIYARVTVLRNGLRSDARLAISIAEQGLDLERVSDADSDGVLDIHEGELDASVDSSAANKLQTVLDDDLSFVMEADTDITLRIGSVARVEQQYKAKIKLKHMIEHFSDSTTNSINTVLTGDTSGVEIFDFNIAALPRVGASAAVVIPLEQPLREGASYVKFHEATGWIPFVVDGLNKVRSAPAIVGILGQCPPLGHGAYQEGLIAGYACLELTLEDGGPNDADRLNSDGTVAADRGINGNIEDPGAIVYTDTDESTGAEVATGASTTPIHTGTKGGGSLDIAALLLLLLWRVQRSCAPIIAKRYPAQ